MTVKELQIHLNGFEPTAKVLLSSDEELNTLFEKFEVAILDDKNRKEIVIFGLSGCERED